MNHLTSRAELRKQLGARGYFAAVSASAKVEAAERSQLSIRCSDSVAEEWREPAIVGVRIGWRCLPEKYKHQKHVTVSLEAVETQPGDSSEVVVMHVAAKALLALFDATPSCAPSFVPEFGIFIFGK
jgi:hypothetical protein